MKSTDEKAGRAAGIQVICLGSGGGPSEDNVTGFLVRATASNWSKGSILAVDAGSHLSAITRIMQDYFPLVSEVPETGKLSPGLGSSPPCSSQPDTPPIFKTLSSGPFSGISLPFASARANAVHVVREHVSTYLITHPHLDHVSGFVINTAAFHNTTRPKRLAALPFAVNAIKTHIFNDVIWPNLTDEDGGVGLVTFQRLAEGGNIALGEGPGKGFIEVCDGLSAKAFKVSHGHCMKGPNHVHRGSIDGMDRSHSFSTAVSQPGTPLYTGTMSGESPRQSQQCVIDSTAYFIRAEPGPGQSSSHAREVLIFGDVEPDSISLTPRTAIVWAEAAPKIAAGILKGIFMECSYTDNQADALLFGHLVPRHLIAELQNLAEMVREARRELELRGDRKRKRLGPPGGTARDSKRGSRSASDVPMQDLESPTNISSRPVAVAAAAAAATALDLAASSSQDPPLKGVKIVIIHVKDTMMDGAPVGNKIKQQLEEYEQDLQDEGRGLGCEFVVSQSGGSYYF